MDHDPLDPHSQAETAQAIEDNAAYRKQVEEADFKWLMSSKRGRRIVWRLLEKAGVFRLSFTANSMQTSFNEGMRSYGLAVLAQLHELTPDAYPLMLKEQKEHATRNSGDGSSRNNH